MYRAGFDGWRKRGIEYLSTFPEASEFAPFGMGEGGHEHKQAIVSGALAIAEDESRRLYIALETAVRKALSEEADLDELKVASGYAMSRLLYIKSSAHYLGEHVEGSVEDLRVAYFVQFENLLALVALAHLEYGITQARIAKLTGSGTSTISSWVRQARESEAMSEAGTTMGTVTNIFAATGKAPVGLYRADVHPDWQERAIRVLGDDAPLAALERAERALTKVYGDYAAAAAFALRNGVEHDEVKRLSGFGRTYLAQLAGHGYDHKAREGDIAALRTSYFTHFEDMLALVAHAHIDLGVSQASIARTTGYSASAISSWVATAREMRSTTDHDERHD